MLLSSLAENLITLLCYDANKAPTIRGLVAAHLFGGPYREVAVRIYDYLDRFKKPPGDHLPDLFTDKLALPKEGRFYSDLMDSIHGAQEHINAEYVMSRLTLFIKRQSMRSVAIDLAKALQRDTEESLDEAEGLIANIGKTSLTVFDPGTRLSDKNRALGFLNIQDNSMPTGIPELDRRGFGPTRKELWLGIGNSSAGKSWMLMQLAKMALMHRARVCHITLEMSEERCSQRYFQALFAISKRKETFQATKFDLDSLGRIKGLRDHKLTPNLALDDPNIRQKLERRINRWAPRVLDNIYIKQFPTGTLTMGELVAYLDHLEQAEKFVPDLLIVDYPDLMKLPKDNMRLAVDEVYKELRGLMVSRNIAGAVVSQSHRAAATAKQVGMENVAEAFSKIAHCDVAITYSQTVHERRLGLARLHVAKGRNDSDKFTVVISQKYDVGAFVLDSALMVGTYWEHIPHDEDEK